MKKMILFRSILILTVMLFGFENKSFGSVIPIFAKAGLKEPLKIKVNEWKFSKEDGRLSVKIEINNETEYDFNEIGYQIKVNDECKDYFSAGTVIFESSAKNTILSTPKRFNQVSKNSKKVKEDPRNKNMRVPKLTGFTSVLITNTDDGDKFLKAFKEIIVVVNWDTGEQVFRSSVK